MRTTKPILVFVGDDNRATEFMEASDTYVLGAPTLRIALAQTVFSFPDVIIIDASPENMQLAEDTFAHLRSIQHAAIVLLSDTPQQWDTARVDNVSIVANDISHEDLANHVQRVLAGELQVAC